MAWKITTLPLRLCVGNTHNTRAEKKLKDNPFIQTFLHWYQIIAHRFQDKDVVGNTTQFDSSQIIVAIVARRQTYLNSSATTHSAMWRAKCTRVEGMWVPNMEHTEVSIQF